MPRHYYQRLAPRSFTSHLRRREKERSSTTLAHSNNPHEEVLMLFSNSPLGMMASLNFSEP
eukprot:3528134-Amphidinium_carterae.1